MRFLFILLAGTMLLTWLPSAAADPHPSDLSSFLTTGRARFAFDHLGPYAEQLDSVVASGCTAIYASGVGSFSYRGLPPKAELERRLDRLRGYNRRARKGGVRLLLSYLCSTSIIHVADFAKNWDDYFPGRPREFDPRRMLQQDIDGKDLPSWYGAPYLPADMWNPYWREYQKRNIKLVIESGHDGVFFDNPTVHPSGNYSLFAMRAWKRFLGQNGVDPGPADLAVLRGLTKVHPRLWLRFRATEAPDFLREMREYGRSLKPDFFLTANNSLNDWDSFYSQPRQYGYSILELARSEDSILVEDMSNQPRRGKEDYVSYGQNLRMIPAIARGRYLNVCTLAPGEYTTPPNLMKLAIAECTAHDASYLVWSCWDSRYRAGMERAVRRYHDFLSRHAALLAKTTPVSDVLLIWPYERWLERGDCPTVYWGRDLSAGNVQYDVAIETDVNAPLLSRYPLVTFASAEGPLNPRTAALLDAYRRAGGKVAPATPAPIRAPAGMDADSIAPGYRILVPFDGRHLSLEEAERERIAIAAHRTVGEPDNTFRTASGEGEHWVERRWSRVQAVEKIVLWWGTRGSWPERYAVQRWSHNGWRPLIPVDGGWRAARSQREEFSLSSPVVTDRIRLLQDASGGGRGARRVLAVQEFEIHASGAKGNVALVQTEDPSRSLEALTSALPRPSVVLRASPGVRSTVRRSGQTEILHLYNLNVSRSDNYHDHVTAAGPVQVIWVLPAGSRVPDRLICSTPDPEGFGGPLPFTCSEKSGRVRLEFSVPKLWIWSMVTAR